MAMTSSEQKKCQVCGIRFTPWKNSKGLYCDRRCSGIAKRSVKTVPCATCSKSVKRSPGELKRWPISFCGIRCQTKYHRPNLEKLKQFRAMKWPISHIAIMLSCSKSWIKYAIKGMYPNGVKIV